MEQLLTLEQLYQDRLTNALRQFPTPSSLCIPVNCPVSKKRLKHPAISLNCTHSERIELKPWLTYVLESRQWVCPYCKCKAELPDIYIDYPLQQKLEEAQGDLLAQNVEIDASGEYVVTRKMTKQRSSVMASALGGDSSRSRRGVTVMLKGVDNPFHDFMLTSSEDGIKPSTGEAESSGFSPPTVYLLEPGMPFIQKFNINNNKWRTLGSIPNPGNSVVNMRSVYTDLGVFFLGGQDGNRNALRNVYQLKENLIRNLASMQLPRFSFSALQTKNKIYVIGGQNASGLLAECERMDMMTGKWVGVMALPKPKANAGACTIGNEFIFLFGGTTTDDFNSRGMDRFHIASSAWETLYIRLPVGVADPLIFRAPDLDLIFVMGGFGSAGKLRDVMSFSFKTGIWNLDLPRLKVPCVEHAFFPVMFDFEHKVMHFFDGRGGSSNPIKHLYYSIENFYTLVKEEDDSDDSQDSAGD